MLLGLFELVTIVDLLLELLAVVRGKILECVVVSSRTSCCDYFVLVALFGPLATPLAALVSARFRFATSSALKALRAALFATIAFTISASLFDRHSLILVRLGWSTFCYLLLAAVLDGLLVCLSTHLFGKHSFALPDHRLVDYVEIWVDLLWQVADHLHVAADLRWDFFKHLLC